MTETITLQGASLKMHLVVVALVIGLPLLITFLASNQIRTSMNMVVGVTLLIALPIMGFITYSISFPSITLSDGQLTVNAGLYSHSVSLSDINKDSTRLVELENEPSLSLGMRTNGIGLFSYNVGYFNLKNGQAAFVVLEGSRAVIVPTNNGVTFLLSTDDASKLIATIQQ